MLSPELGAVGVETTDGDKEICRLTGVAAVAPSWLLARIMAATMQLFGEIVAAVDAEYGLEWRDDFLGWRAVGESRADVDFGLDRLVHRLPPLVVIDRHVLGGGIDAAAECVVANDVFQL